MKKLHIYENYKYYRYKHFIYISIFYSKNWSSQLGPQAQICVYLFSKNFGSGLFSGAAIFAHLGYPKLSSSRRPVSLSYNQLEVLKIYFP